MHTHPDIPLPVGIPKSLEQENEELRRALKDKEKELAQALSGQRQLREPTDTGSDQDRNYLEKIHILEGEKRDAKKEYREHRDRCHARARRAEDRYNELQSRHDQMSQLLETRSTELRAAQNFLSTEDSKSIQDVVQVVHDLNSEIVQASAALVESLPLEPTARSSVSARQTAGRRVSDLVGPLAEKLLSSFRGEDDMDVLEVIFRGCMVAWTQRIIDAWHLRPGSKNDLSELYEIIYSAEEQAIAGRWRALTRHNIQRAMHGDSNMVDLTSPFIASSLADTIICAGLSDEHNSATKMVMDGLGNKLLSVTEMAHKINKIVGEDITSKDMRVTSVIGGGRYDKTSMENAHDEKVDADWDGKGIICTADLGLRMRVKVNGKERNSVLLKHKVALEGFMD